MEAPKRAEPPSSASWSGDAGRALALLRGQLADTLRGRARWPRPLRAFAAAVLSSLRPHFFVYPAAAALAGAAALGSWSWRVAVAALACALGWGVGQLINDVFDVSADRVDAPERPAAQGLLPPGPTLAVALGLGLIVALATLSVHPSAHWLALAAVVALAAYHPAKSVIALGNVAHGALIGVATLIGAAAARPQAPLSEVLRAGAPAAAITAGLAAVYLQGNYEKDRRGDERAGYRTLALWLSLRQSALLRCVVVVALALAAQRLGLLAGPIALVLMASSVLLHAGSALRIVKDPSDSTALVAYPLVVHATALAYLSLVVALLGYATWVLVLLSAALIHFAARRQANF